MSLSDDDGARRVSPSLPPRRSLRLLIPPIFAFLPSTAARPPLAPPTVSLPSACLSSPRPARPAPPPALSPVREPIHPPAAAASPSIERATERPAHSPPSACLPARPPARPARLAMVLVQRKKVAYRDVPPPPAPAAAPDATDPAAAASAAAAAQPPSAPTPATTSGPPAAAPPTSTASSSGAAAATTTAAGGGPAGPKKPDPDVFYLAQTGEIFLDYECVPVSLALSLSLFLSSLCPLPSARVHACACPG